MKRYFLAGSIFGLCVVPIVAFLLGATSFLNRLDSIAAAPIFIGFVAVIFLGKLADHKRSALVQPSFLRTISIFSGIFICGVVVGALANLGMNYRYFSGELGSWIFDWFVKPVYWLLFYGVPSAIVLAVVYYGAVKVYLRQRG